MDGIEKTAVLLSALNKDVAGKVLALVPDSAGARIRDQLKALGKTRPDAGKITSVLNEVEAVLQGVKNSEPRGMASDNGQSDKQSKVEATTEVTIANEIHVSKETDTGVSNLGESDPFASIRQVPGDVLASSLEGESAKTVGLVLNFLEVEQAGQVYKHLSGAVRRSVSMTLPTLVMPAPEIFRRIVETILQKCRDGGGGLGGADQSGRFKKMATMLRMLDRGERSDLLAAIEENDPEQAQAIKEQMFQFEDLLKFDNSTIQKLLSELDTKTLAMSLKGAQAEIAEKVFGNLSKRAIDTLKEEMDLQTNTPPSDVAASRKSILEVVQRLDQSGKLVMIES